MEVFRIDPNDEADYAVDWAPFIGADTIAAVSWTVPAGVTSVGQSNTATAAKIRLSGATLGAPYVVSCRITLTASGEKFEQDFTLVCEHRT